jgi:hypothetical protein
MMVLPANINKLGTPSNCQYCHIETSTPNHANTVGVCCDMNPSITACIAKREGGQLANHCLPLTCFIKETVSDWPALESHTHNDEACTSRSMLEILFKNNVHTKKSAQNHANTVSVRTDLNPSLTACMAKRLGGKLANHCLPRTCFIQESGSCLCRTGITHRDIDHACTPTSLYKSTMDIMPASNECRCCHRGVPMIMLTMLYMWAQRAPHYSASRASSPRPRALVPNTAF